MEERRNGGTGFNFAWDPNGNFDKPAWNWHRLGNVDMRHIDHWSAARGDISFDMRRHERNARIDAMIARIDAILSK